jgi:hypothetical protein
MLSMHQIKPGLQRQDLEGTHLPSLKFSLKLRNLCQFDFVVFESWHTTKDAMVLPCDMTRPNTNKTLVRGEQNGLCDAMTSDDFTSRQMHALRNEYIPNLDFEVPV